MTKKPRLNSLNNLKYRDYLTIPASFCKVEPFEEVKKKGEFLSLEKANNAKQTWTNCLSFSGDKMIPFPLFFRRLPLCKRIAVYANKPGTN